MLEKRHSTFEEKRMRNPVLRRLGVSLEDYRRLVQEALEPHRLELIRQRADWIRRAERWVGEHLIHGRDVQTDLIAPTLEFVTSDRDHELWRYLRYQGTIPYNRGCGRLLRFIIRDSGQRRRPVMGIGALSSPVLICRPRDTWIGWSYPRDVELKRKRLLTCLDLTVSMAVPPYGLLTCGKLTCLAALSDEVRTHYAGKFSSRITPAGLQEGRLALVTTTSLYGSSVQYNRLRVDGRTAYRLVGYTSGFGNAHVTEAEFASMEQYLYKIGKPIPKGWGTGRSYRLRVYSAYYRHRHGQKHAPAHEQPRSVYVAPLAENSQAFLRGEDDDLQSFDRPFSRLADTWKDRWLRGRLANLDVVQRFRESDPHQAMLSTQLTST